MIMENQISEIKSIIDNHKNDISFVIGNGINRYNGEQSWQNMLLKIWNSVKDNTIDAIPQGISFTEFYDIIHIEYDNYIRKLSCVFDNIGSTCSKVNAAGFSHYSYQNNTESILNTLKEMDWSENKTNLLEHLAIINNQNKYTWGELILSNIQNLIASDMKKWKPNIIHETIVLYIRSINAPILTTNYDANLNSSFDLQYYQLGKKNFSKKNPWSAYYGKKMINPEDGFGIWNINGTIKYPESIKLGLSQYMDSINKAYGLLNGSKNEKTDDYQLKGKNINSWKGRNTWIHLFFNKSLFVFGLTLDENEIFLRWLLIQRSIYINPILR